MQWISIEQTNTEYILSYNETACTYHWVPDYRQEVPDHAAGNWKDLMAISAEPE